MARKPADNTENLFGAWEFGEAPRGSSNPLFDPIQNRRRTVIRSCDEQIEVVNRLKSGGALQTRTTAKGRQRTETFWGKQVQGEWWCSPRYGSRPLEMVAGKPDVKVITLDRMTEFLQWLKGHVNEGKIDALLMKVSERAPRKPRS
jgi:hypothetical protein